MITKALMTIEEPCNHRERDGSYACCCIEELLVEVEAEVSYNKENDMIDVGDIKCITHLSADDAWAASDILADKFAAEILNGT